MGKNFPFFLWSDERTYNGVIFRLGASRRVPATTVLNWSHDMLYIIWESHVTQPFIPVNHLQTNPMEWNKGELKFQWPFLVGSEH